MTLTYRDEYREWVPDGVRVLLPQEWLAADLERLRSKSHRFSAGQYRLLPHCSESALAGESLKDWQAVFQALGSELMVEKVGCCGMAGTYGHESKHADTSRRIYQLSWARKLAEPGAACCATGFSCRSQVARIEKGRSLPHPLQVLAAKLRD